jgi:antitoxin (DNA-binding transcriptional repressor) of toxin-antitoxin stability system
VSDVEITKKEGSDEINVTENGEVVATIVGCTDDFLKQLTQMSPAFNVIRALADYTDPAVVKEETGRRLLQEVHRIADELD